MSRSAAQIAELQHLAGRISAAADHIQRTFPLDGIAQHDFDILMHVATLSASASAIALEGFHLTSRAESARYDVPPPAPAFSVWAHTSGLQRVVTSQPQHSNFSAFSSSFSSSKTSNSTFLPSPLLSPTPPRRFLLQYPPLFTESPEPMIIQLPTTDFTRAERDNDDELDVEWLNMYTQTLHQDSSQSHESLHPQIHTNNSTASQPAPLGPQHDSDENARDYSSHYSTSQDSTHPLDDLDGQTMESTATSTQRFIPEPCPVPPLFLQRKFAKARGNPSRSHHRLGFLPVKEVEETQTDLLAPHLPVPLRARSPALVELDDDGSELDVRGGTKRKRVQAEVTKASAIGELSFSETTPKKSRCL